MSVLEMGRVADEGYGVKVDNPNPDTKTADQVATALRKWTIRLGERVARDDDATARR